jgi:hypothetical protein
MAWNCNAYFDVLFDRAPHFDEDLQKDWYPTDDAWLGKMATIPWEARTGTEHVWDTTHIGAPDLSQAWAKFDTQSSACLAGACTWPEISVCWGSTRKVYDQERIGYRTNVLCFDQINTRAKANKQMADILAGIKEIAKMVQSDYCRRNALMMNDTLYICGSALATVPITGSMFTGAALTMDIGGAGNLPTSALTIDYLRRFYDPLQFKGYFKSKWVPQGMFNLITDMNTGSQMIELNPQLLGEYKFTDFLEGGRLYKYGVNRAIGNFSLSWDESPIRFYWDAGAGVMRRVFPWHNVPATIGVKPDLSSQYLLAPYQVSFIWHPEACKRAVPNMESVNPLLPFMTRDQTGEWHFLGGNRDKTFLATDPASGQTCTIDNKAGNQGLLWSQFSNAIKFEKPEWTRAILHLRDPGCVNDFAVCSVPPAYVLQNYSDACPLCDTLGNFTNTGEFAPEGGYITVPTV